MVSGRRSNFVRDAVKWILIALSVLTGLYLIHQFVLPIVAFVVPSLDPALFDLGVLGAFPLQRYSSFGLGGPQARHLKWHDSCDAGLVLLTPNGPSVDEPGPMMLDARGELVWRSDDFGAAANLKVQQYQGRDYLTLWSGEKAATSGKGVYFMLDETYQVVKMVSAKGDGLWGDLHEFKLTDHGTALLTVYHTTNADLTGMGMSRGPNGWIVDNLFQEIDLETDELLFQWSAKDHFNPVDTYMTNPFGGYWESIPFDFYHLNSVDKDSKGNYIISSRHFHHVACVSPLGDILWILGGRDNQFTDLSDGQATNFKWQHDARWVSEEDGLFSLFDNSKAGPFHNDASESRALVIHLDLERKTATLVHAMTSAQGILASSQGALQLLPDTKNYFVGWGSAAAFSEYTNDGQLLCETHLGASWFYSWERMKSYRTTKTFTWHGSPRDPPQIDLKDHTVSVSWNGATKVAFWSLEAIRDGLAPSTEDLRSKDEDSASRTKDFETLDVVPKTGFEGRFDLSDLSSEGRLVSFRVAALDKDHKLLRYSESYEMPVAQEASHTVTVIKLSVLLGFLVGMRFAYKHYRTRGHLRRSWMSGNNVPAWMGRHDHARRSPISRTAVSEWIQMSLSTVNARPG